MLISDIRTVVVLAVALMLGIVVGAAVAAAALAPSAYASDAGPGTLAFAFGSLGHGPGEFDEPELIAIAPNGKIYVGDRITGTGAIKRMQVFHPNGTFDFEAYPRYFDRKFVFGPDGRIFTGGGTSVKVLHANGTFIQFITIGGGRSIGGGYYFQDVGPDGKVYASNPYYVRVFHPNGTLDFRFGSFGEDVGEFNGIRGVRVDLDGRIHVIDTYKERIQVFHPNGTYDYHYSGHNIGWSDIGPNGERLWGCDLLYPNGTLAVDLRVKANAYGYDLRRCAIGPDGMVFAVATAQERVVAFNGIEVAGGWKPSLLFERPSERPSEDSSSRRPYTPAPESSFTSGTFAFEFGSLGSGPGNFMAPRNVAFGPGGFMAVADTGNHRVQVFNPDGTFAFALGLRGEGPGEFYWPEGLAFGPGGLLAVADMGNNRVQVFRLQ